MTRARSSRRPARLGRPLVLTVALLTLALVGLTAGGLSAAELSPGASLAAAPPPSAALLPMDRALERVLGGALEGGDALGSTLEERSDEVEGATLRRCRRCDGRRIDRRVLASDGAGEIVQYRTTVRVGRGERDLIRLHRITRERTPFRPEPSRDGVMMVHGDVWGFEAAFLTGTEADPASSLPVFLARQGIDVWGIDFRWVLVPADAADLSPLADWDLDLHIRDLRTAMLAARATRFATGSGLGRLHLLGWSRGGQVGYGYLSDESQRPGRERHAKGFIPVDIYIKVGDPALDAAACAIEDNLRSQIADGMVVDPSGTLFTAAGQLALGAPEQPSPLPLPFAAGLTNRQVALFLGAATFNLAMPVPLYHFVGGTFGGDPFPDALLYTEERVWFTEMTGAAPYMPLTFLADGFADVCSAREGEVPWDDHLAQVEVPVFYLGADGGFGTFGYESVEALGSTDVTLRIVTRLPADDGRLEEVGHADLFLAPTSEAAWAEVAEWMLAR